MFWNRSIGGRSCACRTGTRSTAFHQPVVRIADDGSLVEGGKPIRTAILIPRYSGLRQVPQRDARRRHADVRPLARGRHRRSSPFSSPGALLRRLARERRLARGARADGRGCSASRSRCPRTRRSSGSRFTGS
jgi:hypothetical protein